MLQVLWRGGIESNPQGIMQSLAGLEGLWRDAEDHRSLFLHSSAVATYWADMEAAAEADYYLRLADGLPAPPEAYLRGFGALCRGHALMALGRLDDAAAALETAAAAFAPPELADGQAFVNWARAVLRYWRGDARAAADDLESLAADRRLTGLLHRLALLVDRIIARAAAGQAERARELRADYEKLRGNRPMAIRDLVLYRSLARHHAANGEMEQAAVCYKQAIAVVRDLHPALSGDNQARFLESQIPLADEAKACLAQLQQGKDIARIDHFFSGAEAEEHRAEAERKRDQFCYRAAWSLTALNLAIVALLVHIIPHREHLYRTLIGIPALLTGAAIFIGLGPSLPPALVPWSRSRLGQIMLTMTLIGWPVGLALLVFVVMVLF
jgi:hypothetical protein